MPISSEADNKKSKKGRSPLKPERPATEYAILALLLEGASHGYDLSRRFAEGTELSRVCRLEMSMLYSLLHRLEKDGLISGREEAVSVYKSRRIMEITGQGRLEIENWLNQPVRHAREIRLDFLVKLYFAHQKKPAQALELLEKQFQYSTDLLAQLEAQHSKIDPNFEKLVLDFRIEQIKGILNWLEKCRSQLTS
jgi:PadR family transcriptional regulator, regulatory protein AphA